MSNIPKLAKVAGAVDVAAGFADPLVLPTRVASTVAAPFLRKGATKSYGRALSVSGEGLKDVKSATKTGFAKEILPTEEGALKADKIIKRNTLEINKRVARLTAAKKNVKASDISTAIAEEADRALKGAFPVDRHTDLIQKELDFNDHPFVDKTTGTLTPDDLLAIRRQTEKELRELPGPFDVPTPEKTAKNAVVRKINEILYAMDPELHMLGSESRDLMSVRSAANRRAIQDWTTESIGNSAYQASQAAKLPFNPSPVGVAATSKMVLGPERRAKLALSMGRKGYKPTTKRDLLNAVLNINRTSTQDGQEVTSKNTEPPRYVPLTPTPPHWQSVK